MFSIYETIPASIVREPSFCLDLNSGTSVTLQPGGSDRFECPVDSWIDMSSTCEISQQGISYHIYPVDTCVFKLYITAWDVASFSSNSVIRHFTYIYIFWLHVHAYFVCLLKSYW